MINFKDLGDMTKLAQQAKSVQSQQEKYQKEMIVQLKDISRKLDEVKKLLEK